MKTFEKVMDSKLKLILSPYTYQGQSITKKYPSITKLDPVWLDNLEKIRDHIEVFNVNR